MPRKARFYLPGQPVHVVQRGNCKQAVYYEDDDYRAYLKWLKEGTNKHGCAIHSYVLMTNHVHLLLTPDSSDSISKTIQYVGRNYVAYINSKYGKSGTLWEGRHKGSVINSERYLLVCMRYIEMNPVRAGMVKHPKEYPWSSYLINAVGKENMLIESHAQYLALANNEHSRLAAYRELFRSALDPNVIHDIRASLQTGTPLGNEKFRLEIEHALGCKVGQARRGRPTKS